MKRLATSSTTPKGGRITRHFSSAPKTGFLAPDPIAQTLVALQQPCPESKIHLAAQAGPVFRVRPVEGTWEVFDREGMRVSQPSETIGSAVILAKELARKEGSAQIIVYGHDGTVASEFFYEADQRPALDYDTSTRSLAASRPRRLTTRVVRKRSKA